MGETGTVTIVRIIARLNVGGPAIHSILLSEALNSNGYRSILVTGSVSKDEGDMGYLAREKGVQPVVVPEMSREIDLVNDIKAFFRIYGIIRRERPDIVHTHTAKAGTLGRLAALLAGVPVKVHTFHGHTFDSYFSAIKAGVFLTIERFLALFTDRIITVSETVRSEVIAKLKVVRPSRCVVVPLGLELEKFYDCDRLKGALRKRIGVSADDLLIGVVGRLVPIKNHGLFLDAAAKVVASTRGARRKVMFVIIGDGEERPNIERLVEEKGLSGSVVMTGWINDLPAVYADLDIVALTSLNEGTPVSLIEAMASSRPIVSTAVGGVGDIVRSGDNGILVESGDADGFAAGLAKLIGDAGLRESFGKRGRQSVRERFSKERLVRDIKVLYEECLKEKRR